MHGLLGVSLLVLLNLQVQVQVKVQVQVQVPPVHAGYLQHPLEQLERLLRDGGDHDGRHPGQQLLQEGGAGGHGGEVLGALQGVLIFFLRWGGGWRSNLYIWEQEGEMRLYG